MTLAPGTILGPYRVAELIGAGGMGEVYKATDQRLGRTVAIKVLPHTTADSDRRQRFEREARAISNLNHPNICTLYDVGEQNGLEFLVMEYVDGETLGDELRRRRRLPSSEVAELGRELAEALAASHAAGLVHRDVKPRNVLRGRDGTTKLGDFGIASSSEATALTEQGSVLGTAEYLAPEQARGDPAGPWSDLYALGVVLYEALAGRRPYEAASLPELVARREHEPLTPPSAFVAGIPSGLEAAILACLAVRPEHRPTSAAALAAELAGRRRVHRVAAEAPTVVLHRAPPKRRWWVLAALVLVSLSGALVALAVDRGDRTAAPPATTRAHRTTTHEATTTAAKPLTPPRATAVVAAHAAKAAPPRRCPHPGHDGHDPGHGHAKPPKPPEHPKPHGDDHGPGGHPHGPAC
jgi:eukaryotic-like serine/threonine-protein kinase